MFKVDWILSEPVPWTNPDARRAGTLHIAGTLEETIAGERAPNQGRLTDRPYVLAVQPTVPDPTAPVESMLPSRPGRRPAHTPSRQATIPSSANPRSKP